MTTQLAPARLEPDVVLPEDRDREHSRRSVLRGIGLGALSVTVAGIGALSYRVYDNGILDAGDGTPYDAWTRWRNDPGLLGMVGAAILAANPHNSQPWIFDVTPERIDLFADASRRLSALDPLDREHHIGLGCALENLVLASAARGYVATVTLMPQDGDPSHVASVELASGPVNESTLYEAIGERRSNRGPYTTQAVSAEVFDTIDQHVDGLSGITLRWLSTETERSALGALILQATEAVVADEEQSRDSFAWFRSTRDDIVTHMDGLTLDAQGLGPVTLTMAKLLPASSRTAGDKFWVDQTRTVHTRTAAAYGVITVADPDDPVLRLTGGRLLERIHLAVTAEGMALQHMNQITERIDREQALGEPATFAPLLDALLGRRGQQALSSFRIGHPVRSAGLSPRRPIEAVTR